MTEKPNNIVKTIYNLKNDILKSNDQLEIALLLEKVIEIANDAPLNSIGKLTNKSFYSISRKKSLDNLRMDLKLLKDGSYHDLEFIHFQIACSILSFLLTMTNGVSDVDKIINDLEL